MQRCGWRGKNVQGMVRRGRAQGSLRSPARASNHADFSGHGMYQNQKNNEKEHQRISHPAPNPPHAHPEASWVERKRILSRFPDWSVRSEKVSSPCRFWEIPEPHKAEVTWSSSGGFLSVLIRESNIVWKHSLHLSSNLTLLQDLGIHRPRPHSLPALQRRAVNTSSPNRWWWGTCPDSWPLRSAPSLSLSPSFVKQRQAGELGLPHLPKETLTERCCCRFHDLLFTCETPTGTWRCQERRLHYTFLTDTQRPRGEQERWRARQMRGYAPYQETGKTQN